VDPNPVVSGRGVELLRSVGIRVDIGLTADKAGELIEHFACFITTGLPLVASKVGMSLDGKIGTGRPDGRNISSAAGREFGHSLRLRADALLVGIGTVLADDPELTYRGAALKGRPLIRVILDSNLRTPLGARLLRASPEYPVLIFCNSQAPQRRRRALEKLGAEVVVVPSSVCGLELRAVLRELGKRNVLELLVEGGSRIHWSFLAGELVDKFYFVVAPLVLGGSRSVPSVGGRGYESAEVAPKFRIRRSFAAGSDVVVEAYPSFSRSIVSPWLPAGGAPSGGRDPLNSSKRI